MKMLYNCCIVSTEFFLMIFLNYLKLLHCLIVFFPHMSSNVYINMAYNVIINTHRIVYIHGCTQVALAIGYYS